jgi:hypothetical protein
MTRLASAFVILLAAAGGRVAEGDGSLGLNQFGLFRGIAIEFATLAFDHVVWAKGQTTLVADICPWWPDYIREAEWRQHCWAALARWNIYPVDYNRQFLLDCLGEEAFNAGRMPAPMPCLDDIWRYP